MNKKLKIYNGYAYLPGISGQQEVVIATTSQKRVAQLTGLHVSFIRKYWGQGSHSPVPEQWQVVVKNPEILFYRSALNFFETPYTRYEETHVPRASSLADTRTNGTHIRYFTSNSSGDA